MNKLSELDEISFRKALNGYSESDGGLNLEKLKYFLSIKANIPNSEFKGMRRVDVEKYGIQLFPNLSTSKKVLAKKSPTKINTKMVKGNKVKFNGNQWIVKGESGMTVKEENYCRCLAHISTNEKLTPEAICRSKVKPGLIIAYVQGEKYHYHPCSYYYANYYKLPDRELKSLSKYHNKSVEDFQSYIDNKKKH